MRKEVWETTAIALEYFAFFLAAPDFLGEHALAGAGRWLGRVLSPLGAGLGRLAAIFRSRIQFWDEGDRGLFVLVVIVIDLVVLPIAWSGRVSVPELLEKLFWVARLLFLFANMASVLYLFQMTIEGAQYVLKLQSAKGLFFMIGALFFTASKAVSAAVALEYLGRS